MQRLRSIFLLLSVFGLLLTACRPSAVPVVQTVVNTVPVEVTRIVEIVQTVEVTRAVEVTRLVEVQVTPLPTDTLPASPTPTALTASPTPQFTLPAAVPAATALPAVDNLQDKKVPGISILRIENTTDELYKVSISGPLNYTVNLKGGRSDIRSVLEGVYTYTVWSEATIVFAGTITLNNPDKHVLAISEHAVNFSIP